MDFIDDCVKINCFVTFSVQCNASIFTKYYIVLPLLYGSIRASNKPYVIQCVHESGRLCAQLNKYAQGIIVLVYMVIIATHNEFMWYIFPYRAGLLCCHSVRLNTLRPRQDGPNSADDVFKCIPWMKMFKFCLRFHWNFLSRIEITIFQH